MNDNDGTDSEDEWYSRMEQESLNDQNILENDNFHEQDHNSDEQRHEITDEEYYNSILSTNVCIGELTFQPERSSIWYDLMKQSLKQQQLELEATNASVSGMLKIRPIDISSILSIRQFLFSHLPKSGNVYTLVEHFDKNSDTMTVFTDHVIHPANVLIASVDSMSNRIEVAFYSSLRCSEINFKSITKTIVELMKEHIQQTVMFSSLASDIYETYRISELPSSGLQELWIDRCELYALVEQSRPSEILTLPNGYSYCTLSAEDATLINETWKYKTEHSIHMVRTMIESGHCVGIQFANPQQEDENGSKERRQLVAWCLTYKYGAIGMLFTVEEHRRLGLAYAVVSELINKRKRPHHSLSLLSPSTSHVNDKHYCEYEQRCPPFCYIERSNYASKTLFCTNLGFSKQVEVDWVGLDWSQ